MLIISDITINMYNNWAYILVFIICRCLTLTYKEKKRIVGHIKINSSLSNST